MVNSWALDEPGKAGFVDRTTTPPARKNGAAMSIAAPWIAALP